MLGPYAYTPPIYWFTNKNLGGAYGFNTETCPGANVQPIESIKKMLPEENLWPIDDVWNFHCGKNEFSTIDRFKLAVEKRYGVSNNVEEFAMKSQVLNYELMRPMFEAFQANKGSATGIIQWMLNSAWPEMYWQLYGHDLMPNGAFYGAKSACKPIHLLYDYGENSIRIINDSLNCIYNYKAEISIYDINSKLIYSYSLDLNLNAESQNEILLIPEIDELTETYFLDLKLFNIDGNKIDQNFYWLSTKKDILDYEAEFESWTYYTPSKEYADFTLLNSLPKVKIEIQYNIINSEIGQKVEMTLKNINDSLAFFIELQLVNKKNGEVILPVLWEDNYISLLPNEERNIEAKFSLGKNLLDNVDVRVRGWNISDP